MGFIGITVLPEAGLASLPLFYPKVKVAKAHKHHQNDNHDDNDRNHLCSAISSSCQNIVVLECHTPTKAFFFQSKNAIH